MSTSLRNGHWPIFLFSSLSSIGNLFLPIILVRLLSTEDIGIYKIFFLHLSAIPFLVMAGGPVHSVYYWVKTFGEERKKYFNATWILTLVLSSLVIILGFPLKSTISGHLDIPFKYVSILLMAGFLSCPTVHFSETSIAVGKSALGSVFDTFFEIIKASGFIFIGWKFKNLEFIFTFFVILLTFKLIFSGYLNRKINAVSFKTDREFIKKVFFYSLPISLSSCLGFFVDKIDLLLLSSHLDASSFAFYSMGCLVVPPLYLLEMSVQKVLIPNLSQNYIAKNWKEGSKSFQKAIADIALLIIPSIFGLVIFATPIVKLLYTDNYLASAIYLKIFAFSYLLLILPHDSVARATGNTKWILKVYILVTPISLIAASMAAKYLGIKGILIVTILVKFIPKILGFKLSKDLMNWKWMDMFPIKKMLTYVILCSVLSAICLLLKDSFKYDLQWFLICGTGFGVVYLFSVYFIYVRGKNATT